MNRAVMSGWSCAAIAIVFSTPAAADAVVNCGKGQSLQAAVAHAQPGDTILFKGTCPGTINIRKNRLTLKGLNGAVIDGGTADAIAIGAVGDVALVDVEIKGKGNGILASGGAQFSLVNANIHDNGLNGISLNANSSATVADSQISHNGRNGIDVENSSSVILTGKVATDANGLFGIFANNAASVSFNVAQASASHNVLGIQIGTSSAGFVIGSTTTITVESNATTGLTVVSGAHMVLFGGHVIADKNGVHGISVDSKGGLDLDAAALVDSHDNGQDGVHLEEISVMTIFNTPAFSGAPGVTTLNATANGRHGISVESGSSLVLVNKAALNSTGNAGNGVNTDNGSSITLIASILTGNAGKDLQISFGSRADVSDTSVGTYSCDKTVLTRGTVNLTCPH